MRKGDQNPEAIAQKRLLRLDQSERARTSGSPVRAVSLFCLLPSVLDDFRIWMSFSLRDRVPRLISEPDLEEALKCKGDTQSRRTFARLLQIPSSVYTDYRIETSSSNLLSLKASIIPCAPSRLPFRCVTFITACIGTDSHSRSDGKKIRSAP
jgi:hypothetical protein